MIEQLLLIVNTTASTPVAGADERNAEKLRAKIREATRWQNVEQVFCGGSKLESCHLLRVHGVMCGGRPLVVLGDGEEYDSARWASIAERPESEDAGCCVVM